MPQGAAVILDAIFALPAQRAATVDLTREFSVPFDGLWIDAQEEMRVSRVKSRKRNISGVMEIIVGEQSDYDLVRLPGLVSIALDLRGDRGDGPSSYWLSIGFSVSDDSVTC